MSPERIISKLLPNTSPILTKQLFSTVFKTRENNCHNRKTSMWSIFVKIIKNYQNFCHNKVFG